MLESLGKILSLNPGLAQTKKEKVSRGEAETWQVFKAPEAVVMCRLGWDLVDTSVHIIGIPGEE